MFWSAEAQLPLLKSIRTGAYCLPVSRTSVTPTNTSSAPIHRFALTFSFSKYFAPSVPTIKFDADAGITTLIGAQESRINNEKKEAARSGAANQSQLFFAALHTNRSKAFGQKLSGSPTRFMPWLIANSPPALHKMKKTSMGTTRLMETCAKGTWLMA